MILIFLIQNYPILCLKFYIESIYGSNHLLSHLTERLSSRRFLHALQNFLLKWVGSDQQWATGFFKLLNIIKALIIKRREILFFINSVNYNKCVLFIFKINKKLFLSEATWKISFLFSKTRGIFSISIIKQLYSNIAAHLSSLNSNHWVVWRKKKKRNEMRN